MGKDIEDFFDAYIEAQTYDANLTRNILWEELGAHAPYFYLERMAFLVAFGIFDQTYHGIMRSLYDVATANYNREVPHDYAVVKTTTASPIADILTPMTSG